MCQQPSLTNTPHISLVSRRVTAPERAFWKPAAHSIDLGPRGCQHPIEQLFLQTVHVSLACLTLISIICNERDLRSNFWCLILAISVTSLLLQNTLWFKQKFVGVMLSICLTWEARGMNRTVSSCLSSNKHTKACINYNILLHHQRDNGLCEEDIRTAEAKRSFVQLQECVHCLAQMILLHDMYRDNISLLTGYEFDVTMMLQLPAGLVSYRHGNKCQGGQKKSCS